MQKSKINEWLQISASLGVLAGLLLVAYEIREFNRVATSESVREIEDCFNDVYMSEYETNISELIVKSVEEPGQLSAAEKLKLNGQWESAETKIQTIMEILKMQLTGIWKKLQENLAVCMS